MPHQSKQTNILTSLKSFLTGEIKIPQLKNLIDIRNVRLHLISIKNSPLVHVDKSDKSTHITINVASSDFIHPDGIKNLQQVLLDQVQLESKPILEARAAETVNDLATSHKYQEEVEYFTGKIPDGDVMILRAAYYLRSVYERGGDVHRLRDGIQQRYGRRGLNISNLCSEHYFETYFRPLYEELSSRSNFNQEMFLSNYELVIKDAPFAYFVPTQQNIEEIIPRIKEKLVFNRRYGWSKLAIHAIGRDNIFKVDKVLASEEISTIITEDIEKNLKGNALSVTIYSK